MVLAATPNQHSSRQRRRCSTTTIEIDGMALMQCPSVLFALFRLDHFLIRNVVFEVLHAIRTSDFSRNKEYLLGYSLIYHLESHVFSVSGTVSTTALM